MSVLEPRLDRMLALSENAYYPANIHAYKFNFVSNKGNIPARRQ